MSERQAPSYKMHSDWQSLLRLKKMSDDKRFTSRSGADAYDDYYRARLEFIHNHADELNRIFYGQGVQQ